MKKIILSILLVILGMTTQAQECSFYITFNNTDCLNCYVSLNYLGDLDQRIKKTLIIKNNDKAAYNEFAESLSDLKKTSGLSVVFSDRLHARYNHQRNFSYCSLYIDNKEVFDFPLKEFQRYAKAVNMLGADLIKQKAFCDMDSAVFSDHIRVYSYGKKLFIYDYQLNKIAVADSFNANSKHANFKFIRPGGIDKNKLMQIANLDTAPYYKVLPKLKKALRGDVGFQSLCYLNDTLYIWAALNYPEKREDKKFSVKLYYFMLKYVDGIFKSALYIDYPYPVKSEDFDLNNGSPFYVNGGNYHFPMGEYKAPDGKVHITSLFQQKTANTLSFVKMDSITVPDKPVQNAPYALDDISIHGNYYVFGFYPFVYNVRKQEAYNFSEIIEKKEGIKLFETKTGMKDADKELNIFTEDAEIHGGIVRYLYKTRTDNTLKLAYIDTKENKLIYWKKIENTADVFGFLFIDDQTLIGFSGDKKKIFFFK